MSKTYHRDNCLNKVRAIIRHKNRIVSLTGKHAFEWEVIIEGKNSIASIKFKNRKDAKKEFDRIKKL